MHFESEKLNDTETYSVVIKYNFMERVTLDAVDWAKQNCPSYITNTIVRSQEDIKMIVFDSKSKLYLNDCGTIFIDWPSTYIKYIFTDAKDATLFALKWT